MSFTMWVWFVGDMMIMFLLQDEGDLNESTVITGTVNGGRFGISVVNLGDLNNDGFEGTQWQYQL